MEANQPNKRMDRRDAIKWMLSAAATVPFLNSKSFAQAGPAIPTPDGYGFDPNLVTPSPAPWERILTDEQLKTVSALADVILPRVDDSPSASELNVPDFIDEWISAPFETQQNDKETALAGIEWLDSESNKRFGASFDALSESQKKAICDDICYAPKAKSEFKEAANFFNDFRRLTMGGYYTTNYGTKEVGYVGNVALATFDGPPKEVLDFLGVDGHPW
ncbi:MAG: hypothetical protein CBD18_01120 [Opitutales bacterium TMED158]|nr:MAG: hypothetical protein CBD18_01120 [Opitutales bacterium TMED158]